MFLQVVDRHLYECEEDWKRVAFVMYDMMVGLDRSFHHPVLYPACLSKNTASILRMVSCSSALPVSVTGSLFTVLQQSWLDCRLTVFCFFQLTNPTVRLGTCNYTLSIQRHPFFKPLVWEELLQKHVDPPITPVITNVSTTGFVFNFCRMGLSLKLHVKGESKSCRKHASVKWRNLLCWRHWRLVARCYDWSVN
jgi:hypothetical protein